MIQKGRRLDDMYGIDLRKKMSGIKSYERLI